MKTFIILISFLLLNFLFPTSTLAFSCPNTESFTANNPVIDSYELSYPSIVRSSNNASWLMFTGGIVSRMPLSIIQTAPNGEEHIRYPSAQEEIWVLKSSDLDTWSTPSFSFNIMPETIVSFKQNKPYGDESVYPNGFKTGCTDLEGDCNVQINDASVVRFNNRLYMYFTILENYRWFDGTIAENDTANRNLHAIGLALSDDDGQSWIFVDKVLLENENDSNGDPILGAWSPSAVVTSSNNVDIYFNDAYGTKQYVAHMDGGVSKTSIERLNKNDQVYRVNLDVIQNGSLYEVLYNDSSFNISRTYFTNPSDFGTFCASTVVVASDSENTWATPHQIIDNGKVHLFFWKLQDPSFIYHWSRNNTETQFNIADLEPDGDVDGNDFLTLIENFLLNGVAGFIRSDIIKNGVVDIFDFNKLITNFGQ